MNELTWQLRLTRLLIISLAAIPLAIIPLITASSILYIFGYSYLYLLLIVVLLGAA